MFALHSYSFPLANVCTTVQNWFGSDSCENSARVICVHFVPVLSMGERFHSDQMSLSKENKVKKMLCPTSPQAAKLVNKFIGIMFNARESIDKGENILSYPNWDPNQPNPFLNHPMDYG